MHFEKRAISARRECWKCRNYSTVGVNPRMFCLRFCRLEKIEKFEKKIDLNTEIGIFVSVGKSLNNLIHF